MRELFVWYRVDERRAEEARAAVTAMQRALVATCAGLQARLLVRRTDRVQTWMETYAFAPGARNEDGISATIEAAIAGAARALDGVIEGERHVEAFDPVEPR